MTKVQSFIHGIYPRSAILAQTTRDVGRGRKTLKDLEIEYKKDLVNLISLQKREKLDYVEDGKLNWQDIFRPIVQSADGLTVGPLTRWFDNNSFFRQPVVGKRLKLNTYLLDEFFPKITQVGKWKVTLPSPYLFAKVSKDANSKSFDQTLSKITELLKDVIAYLENKGVDFIQLNEPFIPYHKVDKKELARFKNSVERLSKNKKVMLAVQFYFGDASDGAKALREVPIDAIGIDFYKTPLSSLPKINSDVVAGIVEGRNSLIENPNKLNLFVKSIIKKLKPSTIYISNNSDLELLPETVAKQKIEVLGRVSKYFN